MTLTITPEQASTLKRACYNSINRCGKAQAGARMRIAAAQGVGAEPYQRDIDTDQYHDTEIQNLYDIIAAIKRGETT